MVYKDSKYKTDLDASLGLIYRLNRLWVRVDDAALAGENDKWNYVLDRLYCNLLYRNEMKVQRIYECLSCGYKFKIFGERKECPKCIKEHAIQKQIKLIEISDIKLSEEDKMVYQYLTNKIKKCKNAKLSAIKNGSKSEDKKNKKITSLEEAKEAHYHAIMMKDIWLRKFMMKLKLYLKEVETNPGRSLFGGR